MQFIYFRNILIFFTFILFSTFCIIFTTSAKEVSEMTSTMNNFYQSQELLSQKVKFKTLYNNYVAGNLYIPKDKSKERLPGIIVGHPMGAVKEQSANLYAQKLSEEGFITLSIDLPYWGESEGSPRNSVLPDMYSEAFSAAVDYLESLPNVEKGKIGVIGICGSGSFAISAAKIDPRLKAIVTVSMYDMGEATRHGLNHSLSPEDRQKILLDAAQQRSIEFAGGEKVYTGGTVQEITSTSSPIEKEFFSFYRTSRGEVIPSGATKETTTRPTLTSNVKFMNFYPFNDIETISPRPLLFIAGENAHSIEFSKTAYAKAAEPKELLIVPNAGHVDLYDRTDMIPFDKITLFFKNNLK